MNATDLALQAWEARPHRAEPLADLARYYREKGMNRAAVLFAEQAMAIPYPSGDLLFVEDDAYRWKAREDYAIAAFYVPEHRERGAAVCDALALDRSVPEDVRRLAWDNLFHYARPLAEAAPSFKARRIGFTAPEGYRPCNPSVCLHRGELYANVRTVNYLIGDDGRYSYPAGTIHTRNFLCRLSDDLEVTSSLELREPPDFPLRNNTVLGFEDIRLWPRGDELWVSATCLQHTTDGWCEIVTAMIKEDGTLINWSAAQPPISGKRHEKNWMPIIGSDPPQFVYSLDPTRIIGWSGWFTATNESPWALAECGGSGQVIPFHEGYLALVHERVARAGLGQRQYQRRWVYFDRDMRVAKVSQRFQFAAGEGEFCCGLCWHPDRERLVVTYGVLDREAWIGTVLADDVFSMLEQRKTVAGPQTIMIPVSVPSVLTADLSPPLRYNQPLLTQSQVDAAVQERVKRGLPLHNDVVPWKNWDNWLATLACVDIGGGNRDHIVMDAGGDHNSAFLPGLHKLGYSRLWNLNTDITVPKSTGEGIHWLCADITSTGFGDKHFDFVACLSVIEHGVNWRRFIGEMARVIRPGGHLFVSYDYWETPINTGDRTAFGAPVWLPDADEVRALVTYATGRGFLLTGGELDLECRDRVVSWLGLDFTFMSLLFRRE